jgi:hypothetical protein
MITDLDVQHELLKVALLSTDNYLSIEEAAQDAGIANAVMMKDFLYHYDSAYRALVSIGILDQHEKYMQNHLNSMWKMSHDDDATLADNPYAETTGMSGEMGESKVWDQDTSNRKHEKLTPASKAKAKARAKNAGRAYPNMIDNMWAAQQQESTFQSFCDFHDSGIVEEEFTSNGNELYEDWGEVAEQVDGKTLNKPFLTPNGPKKRAVYVKNDSGNVVKVNFGDPHMEIKRDNPERRKSYRARHNCDNPGPKHKANYWSCKFWSTTPVSKL